MMIMLICIACAASADAAGKSGKSMAGIGLSETGGKNGLKFSFSHAVGEHWTAGASVSIYAAILTGHRKESEMYEHELEFSDIGDDTEKAGSHSESILLQYWPRKAYEGIFLMAGGRHVNGKGMDCTLGIGCYLPLWKGLKAAVSLETGLKDASEQSRRAALGLCYIF